MLAPASEPPGEPDYSLSISGRGASNSLYDLITVDVTFVVSSERLPEIYDAVQRYGFATITDVDITQVDAWRDLEEGYSYGSEHVVRMDMTLELIYLRSWTTATMPASVKAGLGIQEQDATTEENGQG